MFEVRTMSLLSIDDHSSAESVTTDNEHVDIYCHLVINQKPICFVDG
jgi:hypothetical protein